jgi:hypothetical protein
LVAPWTCTTEVSPKAKTSLGTGNNLLPSFLLTLQKLNALAPTPPMDQYKAFKEGMCGLTSTFLGLFGIPMLKPTRTSAIGLRQNGDYGFSGTSSTTTPSKHISPRTAARNLVQPTILLLVATRVLHALALLVMVSPYQETLMRV